jgi:exodeoxyribonuclease VII large subunit
MHEPRGVGERVPVLSVSELNRRLRRSLESEFADVWVWGEVSNFRVPPSGHFYFSLKDERSQIAAVMFRSATRVLPFRPRDGLEVIARGRVSLYDARGDLQLYVDWLEPRGLGGAQLALEQLKRRLAAEGLFDAARKRELPAWPRAVGVVTALSGAAVHDVVTTLRGRMRQVRIVVRPVRVQGQRAGADIAAALVELNAVPEVDVIIVGRGGGSLEDLWAFNEERVVRAIAASRAPVVSAVGHEIDFTLADLVADRRAATPTAAAALVVPDGAHLTQRLAAVRVGLVVAFERRLRSWRERVTTMARHVRDPRQSLRAQRLRVDELSERCRRALEGMLRLSRERHRGAAERLQALSPLAVLDRGYAIARRVEDGSVVRAAEELSLEQALRLVFRRGAARVRVEETYD